MRKSPKETSVSQTNPTAKAVRKKNLCLPVFSTLYAEYKNNNIKPGVRILLPGKNEILIKYGEGVTNSKNKNAGRKPNSLLKKRKNNTVVTRV